MRNHFCMIDQFLLTIELEDECESPIANLVRLFGVEPQILLDLGSVVDEPGDVMLGQEEFDVTELPTAPSTSSPVPAVLPPDNGGEMFDAPEVEPGEEIYPVPNVLKIWNKLGGKVACLNDVSWPRRLR